MAAARAAGAGAAAVGATVHRRGCCSRRQPDSRKPRSCLANYRSCIPCSCCRCGKTRRCTCTGMRSWLSHPCSMSSPACCCTQSTQPSLHHRCCTPRCLRRGYARGGGGGTVHGREERVWRPSHGTRATSDLLSGAVLARRAGGTPSVTAAVAAGVAGAAKKAVTGIVAAIIASTCQPSPIACATDSTCDHRRMRRETCLLVV